MPDGNWGKYVNIFGVDNSSFVHVDKKIILVLREDLARGLDDTTMTAKAKYPINFTQSEKTLALCLHYNGSNSFLFVNAVKMYQFKAKDSEKKPYPLRLGNISKHFAIYVMKKTVLKRAVNVFFCWL